MEFEFHEIHGIWDSWNLRFMEFEFHEIHGIWDSWNLNFMRFMEFEIHGIWKGALVPLLISLCLFCRFLSLIAIDKKNSIHFVQRPFPLVIRGASDIFSRERILLLSISFSPGAKHCNRLTRRYLNVNKAPWLSFSCITDRRNHASKFFVYLNLHLTNFFHIFSREGTDSQISRSLLGGK